jgi:hypothetical protein
MILSTCWALIALGASASPRLGSGTIWENHQFLGTGRTKKNGRSWNDFGISITSEMIFAKPQNSKSKKIMINVKDSSDIFGLL